MDNNHFVYDKLVVVFFLTFIIIIMSLLQRHLQIEVIAKTIFENCFSGQEIVGSIWDRAKEYQNGISGNFQYYKALKAAIEVVGVISESEMSDMMLEFEEEGLIYIEY